MRLYFMAILCVFGGPLILSGCEINNAKKQPVEASMANNKLIGNKQSDSNPKPRPKVAPSYPEAKQVIAWHANQCGGFKLTPNNKTFMGEKELKSFFHFMCLNIINDPNTVMTKLLKLDLAYFWPDDIKQYLWLQKQQVTLQINAKKEQQALNNKMQQTLSSLATIEQQLLLREETKEQ
jgi:hypothetical protein